jgi:hypothetical protein
VSGHRKGRRDHQIGCGRHGRWPPRHAPRSLGETSLGKGRFSRDGQRGSSSGRRVSGIHEEARGRKRGSMAPGEERRGERGRGRKSGERAAGADWLCVTWRSPGGAWGGPPEKEGEGDVREEEELKALTR